MADSRLNSPAALRERERLADLFDKVGAIPVLGRCRSIKLTGPIYESYHSRLFLGELPDYPSKVLIKCNYIPGTNEADARSARVHYDALVRVSQQRQEHFRVPQPFHLFGDQGVVVQSWIDGRSLSRELLDARVSSRRARELMWSAGEWLAGFHRFFGISAAKVDERDLADEIEQGGAAFGPRGAQLVAAGRALQKFAGTIGERTQPVSRLHADFKPANLIVGAEGLFGIDFHPAAQASVCFDIASFLNSATLDAVALRHPSLVLTTNRLHTAFVTGYTKALGSEGAPPVDPLMLQFYLVYKLGRHMISLGQPSGAIDAVKWWAMGRLLTARVNILCALQPSDRR